MGTLIAGKLVAPDGSAAPGWLEVEGDRIAARADGEPPREPDLRAEFVAPGLCDLQVNGACGVEAFDGADALDRIDAELSRRGIGRWLAALPTAEDDRVAAVLDAVAERAADPSHGLAGAHVEGPFLSPDHPGVHRPELLREPADGVPEHYSHPAVRLVTLAPELPGALDLVGDLVGRGVAVALGHSGADAPTALAALDAGARLVTHLFNAMAPLHHRGPGLAGVAMTDPRALPCVIADGHHVDPRVLRVVHAAAGARVVLTSDAASPAAAGPGEYRLAGVAVRRGADGAVRTADGVLAGAAALLDEDVTTWAAATGDEVAAALAAAGARPAAAVGLPATLAVGAPAELVLVGGSGRVEGALRAGKRL